MRHPTFRTVFAALLLLGAAAVLWVGWYSAKRGVTGRWRERVFAEFRARGVEITFKKLTADPLRGFVAREVTVFDANDHQRVLAEIDRLTLNIDWSRLLRKRSFVSALELHDARLSLPLDRRNPQSARVTVEKLHARLLFPEKQIRLVYAEARTLGIRIQASGRIANPAPLEEPPDGRPPEWLRPVERALAELAAVQWKGEAPRLTIRFSGDMNAPESLAASVHLEAGESLVRGFALDSLALTAVWHDSALDLQDLALEDRNGRLHAVGRWVPATGAYEARLDSTLDPVAVANVLGEPKLGEQLRFVHRPVIQAHAAGGSAPGAALNVTASVDCPGVEWKKEKFESLKAAGSWDGTRWSVRELKLVHASGSLSGDVLYGPEGFRAKLSSSLPPSLFALALPEPPASGPLRWLQNQDPVLLNIEAQGPSLDLNACTAWGTVKLGRATFRGVAVEKVETPFTLKGGVWGIGPFVLKRAEGSGEGSITYDGVHNDLFIHKVRLRLNPVEAMKMIEPEWVEEVTPYRFKGPAPLVTVDGKAAPRTPDRTNLNVNVESQGPMDYDFAGKTLPIQQISAQLLFLPRRVRINGLVGKLFNGKIEGNAEILPKADSSPHKASIYVSDMDFASLSRLYTGYDDSEGKLNCSFLWKGDGDDGRKVDGSGEMTIDDGNVFAIPFLGPFSGILNSIIPGAGFSKAHKASASFTVKAGVFNTKNLRIDGGAFSLLGHGDLHFLDDKMQFFARINSRGVTAMMLFPVSKLFEYSADCKLSNPVWKPRILNRGEKAAPATDAAEPAPASAQSPAPERPASAPQ